MGRHGREKGTRVGVQRLLVERIARRKLDDLAEVHHRDPVGDVADHAQIMGDEEVGEAEALLQLLQQVHHLRLDRDIERRDRLVADDELGVERERPGDADALALTAGELVRVAVGEGGVEAHRIQQRLDTVPQSRARRLPVLAQRLTDDAAHRHAGVQAVLWVLEDHLHVWAQLSQRFALECRDVLAAKHHPSRRRRVEAQDDAAGGRLAAAALAHQAERLARIDGEVEPVHRPHGAHPAAEHAPHDREVLGEVLDRNKGGRFRRHGALQRLRRTSRRPRGHR